MVLMAVMIHDGVSLFSIGVCRISKSKLEWSKNFCFIYHFLIKRKALCI